MVAGYQQRRKTLRLPAAPFRFPLLVVFALVGFTVDKAVHCVGAPDVAWLMPAVPVLDSVWALLLVPVSRSGRLLPVALVGRSCCC